MSFILSGLLPTNTFSRATKAHTGAYLADRIAECLREFGIEKKVWTLVPNSVLKLTCCIPKVLAFTADNASNNDTLVDELLTLIPSFGGSDYRVRCFAHILNLVVKVCGLRISSVTNELMFLS